MTAAEEVRTPEAANCLSKSVKPHACFWTSKYGSHVCLLSVIGLHFIGGLNKRGGKNVATGDSSSLGSNKAVSMALFRETRGRMVLLGRIQE